MQRLINGLIFFFRIFNFITFFRSLTLKFHCLAVKFLFKEQKYFIRTLLFVKLIFHFHLFFVEFIDYYFPNFVFVKMNFFQLINFVKMNFFQLIY